MLSKRSTRLLKTDSCVFGRPRLHDPSSPPAHRLGDEERDEEACDENHHADYREDCDGNRRRAEIAERLFPGEPLRREGAREAEPRGAREAHGDVEEEARVRLPLAEP